MTRPVDDSAPSKGPAGPAPLTNILLSVTTARLVAAVLAVITSWTIFSAGAEHYARFAVGVAVGSVIAAFYQMYSKFTIVAPTTEPTIAAFRRAQLVMVPCLLAVSAVVGHFLPGGVLGTFAIGAWSITQGFKEFAGEVLRVDHRMADYAKLYIFDAMITLIGTILVAWTRPGFVAFIVVSGASSFVLALPIVLRQLGEAERSVTTIEVARYSGPLVIASAVNSSFLATVRVAVNATAGLELGGTLNFYFDLFQKPYALLVSSLSSGTIPYMRRHTESAVKVLRSAALLFGAAFCAMAAIAAAASGLARGPKYSISTPLAVAVVTIVFLNRFRSGFAEMPVVLSGKTVGLLIGNVLALLGAWLMLPAQDIHSTLKISAVLQAVAVLSAISIRGSQRDVTRAVRDVSIATCALVMATSYASSYVDGVFALQAAFVGVLTMCMVGAGLVGLKMLPR